ncbi:hypothetical protein [Terrabacter sp. NPDC080008]|uniref:hypothetical protein n=1 Tax=Terrabacter sp. NPDC080008 TaxID=3155176 RepID=UPI00344B3B44
MRPSEGADGHRARALGTRAYLLMTTFRVWLAEIPVAALNAFVLMDHVYAPRVGQLHAHQIAMATRIVIALALAVVIVRVAHSHDAGHDPGSLLLAGLFWMGLWLAFEWAGSLLIRRPVEEILVGWHVERGYAWPYVLLTYLLAPLLADRALAWLGRRRG